MTRLFVGITDRDWFGFLRSRPNLAECNFWQPGGARSFSVLQPGNLFLFKFRKKDSGKIGGWGVFAHSNVMPLSLAWEAFGEGNGANSLIEMRGRVARLRRTREPQQSDFQIGCIILAPVTFLPEHEWITPPTDWADQTVQGKSFDIEHGEGLRLWRAIMERMPASPQTASGLAEERARYGAPGLVAPRLGQGAFRIVVTDAYARRCAVTGERTLPVLEAAHIRPYSEGGEHKTTNGLLLRRDLHTLFDRGYVTVTPDRKFSVSGRIRQEFENGREYYALNNRSLILPRNPDDTPDSGALAWHNNCRYLG